MFEKESKEYAIGLTYPKFQDNQITNIVLRDVEGAFQKGAEFGYNKAFVEADKNLKAVVADFNKANEWHDLEKAPRDLPKGDEYDYKKGIHRKILIQDRLGNIYTGNFYPKDDNHQEDCFAIEFLEYGFQGSRFVAKEQIKKWKEFPKESE